ncbi:putative membrane protein [Planomicrobium sp. HSC-17F08]|nr:putative membrane protein [Planomicrobium sp. HSC-17F08]
MKRSTFVSLLVMLLAFGVYFRFLDPLLDSNRWLAFAVFLLIWMAVRVADRALEGRFEFLDKQMDPQTSVWLTIALFIVVPVLVFSLG